VGRPLYVHVGSRKTGTSALQMALWTSAERLATAGVTSPLVGREPHVRRVLHPLGWTHPGGYVGAVDRPALGRLARRLRRAPGDRIVLTNEDLAEAGPAHVAAFMETAEAAGLDAHVIVTARDWAQQLPSEWQQELKDRSTTDYEAFLTHVRHRDVPDGARFWRRQDVLDICERWGAGLDPARVHVIVVPPTSLDRRAVFRLFAEVVGFDPAVLRTPSGRPNASFGYREAEMLRRLNVVLGDRLPDFNHEYLPAIRRVLVRRVIARGASARVPLPPHHVEWVRTTAEERLAGIVDRGYHVHGEPALLVPATDVGRPVPTVDGDSLADAALETLASFAVVQFEASRNGPARPNGSAGPAADRSKRSRLRSGLRGTLQRLGVGSETLEV
jgi:hypothetical protein